jgi:Holliday junction resolvase
VDAPHKLITEALRKCGWLVIDTSRLPKFVDLVAAKGDRVLLIEVKAGRGKLTVAQQLNASMGWPIKIVRSVDEALAL